MAARKPGGTQPVSVNVSNALREKLRQALRIYLIGPGLGPPAPQLTAAYYVGRDAAGFPMYRIKYNAGQFGKKLIKTKVLSYAEGKLMPPNVKTSGVPVGSTPGYGAADLKRAKDYWLMRLAQLHDSQISLNTRKAFQRQIDSFKGSAADLNQKMQLVFSNIPFGSTAIQEGSEDEDFILDLSGGGAGGSGGFAGPEYRAPDRRVVEDMVKGMMVSLIGTVDAAQVGPLTDLYMKDHRRNFDSLDAEIDPAQSVLVAIRALPAYQEIHELRPASEDERSWISNRRALAEQAGLRTGALEDFAIKQASAAVNTADVGGAAAQAEFGMGGQPTTLLNRFEEVAGAMASRVR